MLSGEALRVVLDTHRLEEQHESGRAGRPDRRRLGRAVARTAATSTSCSPSAAAPTGGRRDLDVRQPVARPLAGALLRRRIAARVPADLAADADDEQGDGDDARHRDDHLGRGQLGIGQGVLDAVADGLIEATGDLIVLVAVWIDGRADDETAVREAAARRCGRRSGCASRAVTRPPPPARRRARHGPNPFYSGG